MEKWREVLEDLDDFGRWWKNCVEKMRGVLEDLEDLDDLEDFGRFR